MVQSLPTKQELQELLSYLTPQERAELDRLLNSDRRVEKISLFDFFCQAWDVLEPGRELGLNWHLELCCEYLELIHRGEILKLIVNIAPRHLKSRLFSVVFPAWEWLEYPWLRYLCLSYSTPLATDLNQERQKLIESDWYQRISGGLKLSTRKNRMTEFENAKLGVMRARGLEGSVTGSGGDRLIFDDPNNPEKVESDGVRESTLRKFKDYSVTRRDDPKRTAVIIVQQRTHELDVSGWVLANDKDYIHVCLPTRAEVSHKIIFPTSKKEVFRKAGELLHPDRFGEQQDEEAKLTLGSYMYAGRHAQKPSPSGGGMFKIGNWRLYTRLPSGLSRWMISVDASFKGTQKSDYVVVEAIAQQYNVKTVVDSAGIPRILSDYYIPYRWRSKADITQTEDALKEAIARFPQAHQRLIEDKANGPAIMQRLGREVSGLIPFDPGSDNKISRAASIQPIHERGGLLLPLAEWAIAEVEAMGRTSISVDEWWDLHPPPHRVNAEHVPVAEWCKEMIDEFSVFPNATNDDQVDATDQAVIYMEANPFAQFEMATAGRKRINSQW
jgi:hypothetical protein